MMEKIRVVIVDDERFSREELNFLLNQYPELEVVGEAGSGEEAVMKTLQLQPDVLFLDVEMPKMDGMEVAKAVQELKKQPIIVFATAYPDFAVEAFRHQAVDYLLKPFEEERLNETVERVIRLMQPETETLSQTGPSRLAVEGEERIDYIDPGDIMYVYRDGRVTKIAGRNGTYETKAPLKEIEERLRSYSFYRIHKSYLVNLDYIDRLTPWFNGAYQLELKGTEERLSVSRNYVKGLRKQLEL
ncbi:UNVERIFIED_CONTAM: LytTR family DNA-binding domain-containing protein [Halobacillus marinus]|uniref:LytR/AlgR family response regulator transcription factor n=1 Tax=Bacillus sp. SB49 TaxID=1071080 RepID=UPI00042608B4|nr:LytTR family DNA-binding domain-containing protein [Bacillus sp. SB49]QHT45340.1 response regulator transcription factor [Bacillus sp. SB49]